MSRRRARRNKRKAKNQVVNLKTQIALSKTPTLGNLHNLLPEQQRCDLDALGYELARLEKERA